MKSLSYLVVGLLLLLPIAKAGEARYETITGTNSITIADYETAELVTVFTSGFNYVSQNLNTVSVTKNDKTFLLKSAASFANNLGGTSYSSSGVGDTVRGPASFFLTPGQGAEGFTVKITPVSFPPNQTLIVPPGTNQVQVSMETSTNLVNWATATNGVYGSPSEARFFRLKMTNLQP